MAESENCGICGGGFRAEVMSKEHTCPSCVKLYPGCKTLLDAKRKVAPNKFNKENEGNLNNIINQRIYDILLTHGLLEECDCGNVYHKRSPNQKSCGDCKQEKKLLETVE